MRKIKDFIRKDKCCIIRCGLIFSILVLVVMSALMHDVLQEKTAWKACHASDAVQNAVVRFDQFVADAAAQIESAAAMIEANPEDNDADLLISGLLNNNAFEDAWIEAAKEQTDTAVVLSLDADSLLLRRGMKSGKALTARIGSTYISEFLRNALQEGYGLIVYDTDTGAYLINTTCFNDGSYYDALLRLNEIGTVEEIADVDAARPYIRRCSSEDGNYHIAQQGTMVPSLGISLVIPEESLAEYFVDDRETVTLLIVSAAVLLASVLAATILMRRSVRKMECLSARKQDAAEKLTLIAARDAGMTLLVCRRNCVIACYDGLNLLLDGQDISNFADLETICSMDSGEIDRVYRCMDELEENSDREIMVRCFTSDRAERTLRFSFHASANEEKSVVCTILDCTQQQESEDRALQEDILLESVKNKASSICQINISRNRWRILHAKTPENMRMFGIEMEGWHDYTAYLTGHLRDYIHPADYDHYAEVMCIPGIAASFRAGQDDFTRDYRIKSVRSGNFEWHRIRTRVWLDGKTNDIIANLCIFNVDAKKNAELERGERKRILQQSLTALGGIYNSLYYVDLENDLAYTARLASGELTSQLCVPYKATFDAYIENYVHPENRDAMQHMLSAYFLRKSMTEGSHFQKMEYRRKIDEDGYANSLLIVQPARFENGNVVEIVLAMRYLDR